MPEDSLSARQIANGVAMAMAPHKTAANTSETHFFINARNLSLGYRLAYTRRTA